MFSIAQADMDVESFEEGFLAKIVFGDGASAPVGATVALLAKNKEVSNSVTQKTSTN
jgi:pyruvate dehydrogenase E2 component (dihydrolipoamide acetyltransferase)